MLWPPRLEDTCPCKESYLRGRRRMRVPVPPPDMNRARVNDKIRVSSVRLINAEGEQLGVVSIDDARRAAQEAELDLVEVAPNARPPVCRIMDYGKFLFEQQKKERAQKKRQASTDVKEIRLRPGTGKGDMEIKARHAREFIADGHKVGIQLQFRGRERAHPEIAIEVIDAFAKMLEDVAKMEQAPRQEGRRMNAVLAPIKKA